MQRHLTCWVENFDRQAIAIIDGQFAGYSLWIPEQGCAELCTINVSQSYRPNGVGRALVDANAVIARYPVFHGRWRGH
ncbi:GNAT family N-acetyltransferase [Pseudomonas sp. ZS1P83]